MTLCISIRLLVLSLCYLPIAVLIFHIIIHIYFTNMASLKHLLFMLYKRLLKLILIYDLHYNNLHI